MSFRFDSSVRNHAAALNNYLVGLDIRPPRANAPGDGFKVVVQTPRFNRGAVSQLWFVILFLFSFDDDENTGLNRVFELVKQIQSEKNKPPACADCGAVISQDHGPPDGWQLEDGRTVCQACCVADTKQITNAITEQANADAQPFAKGDRVRFVCEDDRYNGREGTVRCFHRSGEITIDLNPYEYCISRPSHLQLLPKDCQP